MRTIAKLFAVFRGVYDFVRNNKNIASAAFEKSLNTVTRSVNYSESREKKQQNRKLNCFRYWGKC